MALYSLLFHIVFLCILVKGNNVVTNSLQTPYDGTRHADGIVFDVYNKGQYTVNITRFIVRIRSGSLDHGEYNVWSRPGTWVGFETSSSGWTQIHNRYSFNGYHDSSYTMDLLDMNTPVDIAPNSRRAFFIHAPTVFQPFLMSDSYADHWGKEKGELWASDSYLEMYWGSDLDAFGSDRSASNSVWDAFNGKMFYTVSLPTPPPTPAPTPNWNDVVLEACADPPGWTMYPCVVLSGFATDHQGNNLNGAWNPLSYTECHKGVYIYELPGTNLYMCNGQSGSQWTITDIICSQSNTNRKAYCNRAKGDIRACSGTSWNIQTSSDSFTSSGSYTLVPLTAAECLSTYGISTPSQPPTKQPTNQPTITPTSLPTSYPSRSPTSYPSVNPTYNPSSSPTNHPTRSPTRNPTSSPTLNPTLVPTTAQPSNSPIVPPSNSPVLPPSNSPILPPSVSPTDSPVLPPSVSPTKIPTTPSPIQATSAPLRNLDFVLRYKDKSWALWYSFRMLNENQYVDIMKNALDAAFQSTFGHSIMYSQDDIWQSKEWMRAGIIHFNFCRFSDVILNDECPSYDADGDEFVAVAVFDVVADDQVVEYAKYLRQLLRNQEFKDAFGDKMNGLLDASRRRNLLSNNFEVVSIDIIDDVNRIFNTGSASSSEDEDGFGSIGKSIGSTKGTMFYVFIGIICVILILFIVCCACCYKKQSDTKGQAVFSEDEDQDEDNNTNADGNLLTGDAVQKNHIQLGTV